LIEGSPHDSGEKPELPWHLGHLLAQPEDGGQPRHRGNHGHSKLWQGEPNQVMRTGHTAPACLFANVEVLVENRSCRTTFMRLPTLSQVTARG
jgi:hypothetical protein